MKRNNYLDIVKGICIIFIIVTHFSWGSDERLRFLFPFWVEMAVPVFMIVSGYVYASSFHKNGINSVSRAYQFENIFSKILRYSIPVFMITIIEFVLYSFNTGKVSAINFFMLFLGGGAGPGGYYYPVIIQFVFVFPIIYFLVRNKKNGIFLCLGINVMYEILKTVYGMNETCYEKLVFRYTFVIALGCFLYFKPSIKKRWLVISFMIGFQYLIMICYFHYNPKVITYWKSTAFITGFYIFPIFYFLYHKFKDIGCSAIEKVGKASFHIFCVQRIYYKYFQECIAIQCFNGKSNLFANIVICLGGG